MKHFVLGMCLCLFGVRAGFCQTDSSYRSADRLDAVAHASGREYLPFSSISEPAAPDLKARSSGIPPKDNLSVTTDAIRHTGYAETRQIKLAPDCYAFEMTSRKRPRVAPELSGCCGNRALAAASTGVDEGCAGPQFKRLFDEPMTDVAVIKTTHAVIDDFFGGWL